MFKGPFSESLLKKAQEKGLISINLVNPRDHATDKHKITDDSPYGGGAGMVMKVDVIVNALRSIGKNTEHGTQNSEHRIIFLCPTGQPLTQEKVNELSKLKSLTLICGHYEGIDERISNYVDEYISIGDYVLTGGELPAMVLVDSIARQIPGVIKEQDSVSNDSFFGGLLDHPSYTKPDTFEGESIPEVLKSGHHKEISAWRRKEALKKTLFNRPELFASIYLSKDDQKLIEELLING